MTPKKKILLAEHEPIVLDLLNRLLVSYGYEVKPLTTGADVISTVLKWRPDLIMLDADLPLSSGLGISKSLKNDFITSSIPLILLLEKRQVRKKLFEIEHGVDDYLLKPPDPIDLEVRMEMALRRTEHHVQTSGLTKLPGSREIEKVTSAKIKEQQIFSFLYCDINNFKSFNDSYSYIKGDGVILQTAHIISSVIRRQGNRDDFVGHIGGDDFIIVTTPLKEEAVTKEIIRQFDRLIPLHYLLEDRTRGFIMARDRKDKVQKTPLMSISIAIVNNKTQWIQNTIQLSETVFEIKKHLKTLPGSNYLINRRRINLGTPQRNLKEADVKSSHGAWHRDTISPKPIGQLLVEEKFINEQHLSEALQRHWLSGQKLGEVLISMGLVRSQDLKVVLERFQQRC
ncbi:diguanylate cyclase domain-containing protein [Candidatus Omnitrophota bacterium]